MESRKKSTQSSERAALSNAVLFIYNDTPLTLIPVYNALPPEWPSELAPSVSMGEEISNSLRQLLACLYKREIISWGIPVSDDPSVPFLEEVQIDPKAWVSGDVLWESSEIDRIKFYKDPYVQRYFNITVDANQFRSLFQKNDNATSFQSETLRGRKPSYDWESFFLEVAVRIDQDGLPEIQAEFEKTMAVWCLDTWGKEPAESTVRSKISRVYNHPWKTRGR